MPLRSRSRWLILLPAILGGVVAGLLLLGELRPSEDSRGAHLIGKLVRFEGRVRFKRKGEFIWKDAQRNQPLYRGDLIIAGLNGAAVIKTEQGQEIQLQAGSSAALDDPEKLEGPAVSGPVVVHDSNGEEHFLAAAAGVAAATALPLRLRLPEELSDVFVNRTEDPPTAAKFAWQTSAPVAAASGFLQLSANHFFEPAEVREFPFPAGGTDLEVPVPDGSLYWRLVDSAKKPLSVYRRFHVHGVHALRAESPSGPAVSWDDAVDFQWSHDAGSLPELGSHWIEISGDAAFASLLQKPQIPAHSLRASIRGLPEGRYFWRVASRYGTLTILGPSREFHVRKGQQLAIDPLAPRDAAVVQAGQQLLFEWEANARQADFTLDLEGPPGAARSVETRQKMVAVPDLMVGNYRWRIFGHVGGMQAETPWRRFRILQPGPIALVSPRSGSNIEVAAAGVPVTFDWTRSESPATSEYVLEVASDPEFQRIVGFKRSRTPRTTSAEFNLSADRDYFWRVAVLGPEGLAQALSASSSFRYSIYKGLPAPGDLLPQDGVTCNPLKSKEPCTYSWSEVSGAALYEIEFFNADPGGRAPASSESMRPALRKTVAESSFRTRSLAEGSYYWRVRARDRSGRPGAASPLRRFQLNLGRRLSAPRGRSSEVQ